MDLFTDAISERGMLRDYVCDFDKLTDEQKDDEALLSKATTHAEKKDEVERNTVCCEHIRRWKR